MEKVTAKIKQIFDEINENSHPVGTKTWLREWRDARDIILGALGEWQKTVEKLFENRPKITDEKYLKGISSDRERLRKHIQQFIDDDYDYWANVKRELGLK